jgi:serine/threonine-protein kinase HipA
MPTSRAQECFVYLQLPDGLEVVTCGRFRLEEGVGRFVYGRRYLERPGAVELDCFELPLSGRQFETARMRGMFGALRDASPDSWGRKIIERHLHASDLTEVDYLLHSPEDRVGALSFGEDPQPPAPVHAFNQIIHLEELLTEAARVEANAPPSEQVASLVHPGTSLGGARPKNVVEDDQGLWIAKFPSRGDRWNNAAVEAAMLELAAKCGLRAAATRVLLVGGQSTLLVKRFDREQVPGGYHRKRFASALTVLRADDQDLQARARWSYPLLADELRRWVVHPDEDRAELFGRMVFNALISNADDHPRNHALIADRAGWTLSPAYDLTPTPSISPEHRDLAMTIGDRGRWANRANLVGSAPRFGLSREEAARVVDRMKATVTHSWNDLVKKHGGTEGDCEAVARAFDYPGFEQS